MKNRDSLYQCMHASVQKQCCDNASPSRGARKQLAYSHGLSAPQVLSDILVSCGDNIDAAIKRLGDLRLTANCSGVAVHDAAQPVPAAALMPSKSPSNTGGCSTDQAEHLNKHAWELL